MSNATIHIPTIVFSQTTRQLYTVNDEPAVWVLDVRDSNDIGLTLRYTTWDGQGMMSVYRESLGSGVTADSDRTITCDEHGNPTSITGIQRYMPPSVFCPAYLEPGELWWRRTEGDWLWHPGDNYPEGPALGRYRHDNSWHIDGGYVIHAEEFSYLVDCMFKRELKRGFAYEIAGRLIQFTDYRENETRVYERS